MRVYIEFFKDKRKLLLKYALISNTCFGVLLRSVGDTIQQTIEIKSNHKQVDSSKLRSVTYKTQSYDWNRTKNVSLTGVIIGPLNYYWYSFLDKIQPSKTLLSITKKILLDQIIGATIFTFIFIMTINYLEKLSLNDSLKEFITKFPYIYLVDWLIWPPGQFINFYLIPKEFRVVFSSYQQQTNDNVRLDYQLYSQLYKELTIDGTVFPLDSENDDNHHLEPTNRDIVNYFNLNKDSIKMFNDYLYFPDNERKRLKQLAKSMFEFGYDNYMQHAYPFDELDPIHCNGRGPDHNNPDNININDALGDYMLTLVDALPTLAIMGNSSEFKKGVSLIINNLNFDKNSTIQVFEATIRILGSLLSTHLILIDDSQPFGDMKLNNYRNELLYLAHDLAVRLLEAFKNDQTFLPYPRVNLRDGVPHNSFNHTCTSGAGTLVLEFGMLSRLLDDPIYEKLARKAMYRIYNLRNPETGLLGNELNIHTGEWLGQMSGLGAGIDSYYEYLLKSYVLFGKKFDYDLYEKLNKAIKQHLRRGRIECSEGVGHHPLYVNANMNNGKVMNNWLDSLQASYPGVQVLNGELSEAICMHALYFAIWKKFGVLPERFNWNLKMPDVLFYPLRPEFAESTYFLYRATQNPFYLHVAKSIIENIAQLCKVRCGFATVHDVLDKSLEDRMESFFLSETMKYLYLTFDEENYINTKGSLKYIFTTEGHLFPLKFDFNDDAVHRFDESSLIQEMNAHEKDAFKCNFQKETTSKSFNDYFNKFNLPMKMKYFNLLFDMVGVHENLSNYLERKTSS